MECWEGVGIIGVSLNFVLVMVFRVFLYFTCTQLSFCVILKSFWVLGSVKIKICYFFFSFPCFNLFHCLVDEMK